MSVDLMESWPRRQLLFTARLRQRRGDIGLTQMQVVTRLERCGLRTTNRALSSLEHGAGLEVAKLPALAEALDCSVTYLRGLTDDPHKWEPDRRLDEQDPPPQPTEARLRARSGHYVPAARSLILGAEIPEGQSLMSLNRTSAGR